MKVANTVKKIEIGSHEMKNLQTIYSSKLSNTVKYNQSFSS